MKHHFVKSIAALFLAVCPMAMSAQQSWAIVSLESNQDTPKVAEYHSLPRKGANGIEYMRIYDDSYRFRHEVYNPVETPYGYRMADHRIYVYDYDQNEERVAFDFTLNAGDTFTTYNGMEWVVEEARPSSGIYIQDGRKYVK